MRKWLVFILLLGALLFPSGAGAQGGIKLKSMNVELWSEYDQSSMLVIHEFTVDDSTPLPVQVKLRFPSEGNLNAVAYRGDEGLIDVNFTGPEKQGNWQAVTLNVQSYLPHRIEYYQPLARSGNQRSFSFNWFGDYVVGNFDVTVQLPLDSVNVVAQPDFREAAASTDGLYFIGTVSAGSLNMGQSYEFNLQYERTSEAVSKPTNNSNIQPSKPIGPNTEGRVSVDNLPWVIGGFGLALIGLALFFYWRSTQTPERRPRQRRARNVQSNAEEQAYCHECGARANPGDRFCRTCGSKLKV